MKLKEIKDRFSLFVREFDRCDYSNLMEFLRFLVDEFDDDPNRIYEFIKTSSLNIDTKPLDTKQDPVNIKLVKNIKKAPVVRNILSETYSEIETRVRSIKRSKNEPVSKCEVCQWADATNHLTGPSVCSNCRSFFYRSYSVQNLLKCPNGNKCRKFERKLSCRKCRFEKCLRIGLSLGKPKFTRNQIMPNGCRCVGCDVSGASVRIHYGSPMCLKCSKWHASWRYDHRKANKFRCYHESSIMEDRCEQIDGFDVAKCSKCRYNKILNKINIY